MSLSQEPADLSKQFPDLAEDFRVPQFFTADQFFSSVFRISSCGLQLWTHYDVGVSLFQKGLVKNQLSLRFWLFTIVIFYLGCKGDGQPTGSGDREEKGGPLQSPRCITPLLVR